MWGDMKHRTGSGSGGVQVGPCWEWGSGRLLGRWRRGLTLGGLPDGSHDVRVLLEAKLAKSPHCGLRGETVQVDARTNSANDRQVGLQDLDPVLDQFVDDDG